MYVRIIKRVMDVTLSLLVLFLSLPFFIAIAVLIRVTMGSPVFFRQQRPGRHGRIFSMIKFRTMSEKRDGSGMLLADADRLTGLGRFLRQTSLDELPELLNVLKGDMSLVGPRPLLVQYLERYSPEQARRHDVKPGVTGWAQVNGRNALTWERRFAMDVWYVDHISFVLDGRILLKTVMTVFACHGINHPGQSTMAEFMGTEQAAAPISAAAADVAP